MSVYPLMLDGTMIRALVVGGGTVALRKTHALIDSGALVRVVTPRADDGFHALGGSHLTLVEREYRTGDIGDALLVVAATSSREVNAQVAADALAEGRLVNVVDAPDEGNCTTPAVHRAGDVVIAVTAGGVPSAAVRIRESIAARYADSYAHAIAELGAIRASLLASGDRARWGQVADAVVGPDFCDVVERGEFPARVAAWR